MGECGRSSFIWVVGTIVVAHCGFHSEHLSDNRALRVIADPKITAAFLFLSMDGGGLDSGVNLWAHSGFVPAKLN